MNLDIRKQQVLDLKKEKGLEGKKAQVVLALDYSGSMEGMYRNGVVQEIVERILPLGLAFDDNGEVDFYLFENGYTKLPLNITKENVVGYIDKHVIGKYNMGGTCYAPVLHQIYEDAFVKKSGFLGRSSKVADKIDNPVYIIFITDGDNSDKHDTTELIRKISDKGIFIQFVGIGHASFPYLEKLDDLTHRVLDNCNFFSVKDIAVTSDTDLYNSLLNEFPERHKQAQAKGFIS